MCICVQIDSLGLIGIALIATAGRIVIFSLKTYKKEQK